MPRIYQLAQEYVRTMYGDDSVSGCVIGTRSKSLQRERFMSLVIEELLGDEQDDDDGRLLYIGPDWDTVRHVRDWCDRLGLHQKFREQNLYADRRTLVPKMLNYTTTHQFRRINKQFPAGAVDLLVVDERRPTDFLGLTPLIQRLKLEFTCVLTNQVRSTAWSFVAPLHRVRGSRDT